MRNDEPRGRNGGVFSARSLSSYMRFVSSGASTAASTIRSASASIVSTIANNPSDDSTRDQVHWAGFDKLELDSNSSSNSNSLRQVLLLAYKSGFQIWDVEKSDDVRQLASRHDGPISFLQVQKNPNPNSPNKTLDRFSDSRPLLIVACEDNNINNNGDYDPNSEDGLFPSFVKFYSLKLHDYVHTLKFRSSVHAIRCSPRVVCVSQTSQIHCFNASSLEREYTILTYPISSSPAGAGYGPLAVGPRWIAYSGNPVAFCDAGRVAPQILINNNNNNNNNTLVNNNVNNNGGGGGSLSNTSLVAHYAKESGRQLANGITTLGDIGFQKLSKYYSFNGHNNNYNHNGIMNKSNSLVSRSNAEPDNAGTVIVRDIVSKQVIVQFGAHTSHISALCFDPSGTLLVTASVHGRNINVFRITPPGPGSACGSHSHLYRLQRGLTNAVIKDISFSDDSEWIMISSSRGTSHLFAISPYLNNNELMTDGGAHSQGLHKKSLSAPGPPVTLSVVSRIRNGSNVLKGVVSVATGGGNNAISGAVASAFCKYNNGYNNNNNDYKNNDNNNNLGKDYLLVFSPSGSIIQYLLHRANQFESVYDNNNNNNIIINNNVNNNINSNNNNNNNNNNNRFVVEALQKWDVCHKRNRRDNGEIFDIYGDQDNHNIINNNNININNNNNNISKYSNEESRHLYYISEIELQTHIVEKPLWAKSQICFQVMSKYDNNNYKNEGGEIMIELNATRSIEARSKYLIPVFDSLRTNRVNNVNRQGSQGSCSSLDYNNSSSDDVAPSNGSIVNNINGHGQFVNRNNSAGGDHVSEAQLQFNNVNNINNNNNNGGFLPDLL